MHFDFRWHGRKNTRSYPNSHVFESGRLGSCLIARPPLVLLLLLPNPLPGGHASQPAHVALPFVRLLAQRLSEDRGVPLVVRRGRVRVAAESLGLALARGPALHVGQVGRGGGGGGRVHGVGEVGEEVVRVLGLLSVDLEKR